jgi:hypothetical protein
MPLCLHWDYTHAPAPTRPPCMLHASGKLPPGQPEPRMPTHGGPRLRVAGVRGLPCTQPPQNPVRPHAMPKPPPRTHAAPMHAAREREGTVGPASYRYHRASQSPAYPHMVNATWMGGWWGVTNLRLR